MLGRLSIFVVTTCVLNALVYGGSISLQQNPSLATKGHAVPGTMQFDTVSHAITGDLGRGFSTAAQRSPIQPTGRELHVDAVPRGSLIRSVNRQRRRLHPTNLVGPQAERPTRTPRTG
jgi:hypothetical protein